MLLNITLTIPHSTEETAVINNPAAVGHQATVIPSMPELRQRETLHTNKKIAREMRPVRRTLVAKHVRPLAKREMKLKTLDPADPFTIIDIRTEELVVKNMNGKNFLYCLVSYEVYVAVCQTYFFSRPELMKSIESKILAAKDEFLKLRGKQRKNEQACK